jgi:hypothetical protein
LSAELTVPLSPVVLLSAPLLLLAPGVDVMSDVEDVVDVDESALWAWAAMPVTRPTVRAPAATVVA